jgi:hypothetical protein
MINKMEPTSFTSFNTGLFDRMRNMNRAWLESLREIRQVESEYGARLLTAESPSEATAICNEWMGKRLEIVASEQKTFATAWLGLISDVIKSTSATRAPDEDHKTAL